MRPAVGRIRGEPSGVASIVIGAQPPKDTSVIGVATLRRIATVDERYQSRNVEMPEVIGGNF